MDGNGRWAKQRYLPRKAGHRAGAKTVRSLIEQCTHKGIGYLTLFAFSSENWQRPQDEVSALLQLFFDNLEKELPTLQKNNIRLQIIGEREKFSEPLQQRIAEAEQVTEKNTGLRLLLATSYGGRWDICQAARRLAQQVAQGELTVAAIDETVFAKQLTTVGVPDPDLLIRTSGEQRMSNFLLWQLAYAEFYVTTVNWPDFNEAALDEALVFYANRQRRFGLTN